MPYPISSLPLKSTPLLPTTAAMGALGYLPKASSSLLFLHHRPPPFRHRRLLLLHHPTAAAAATRSSHSTSTTSPSLYSRPSLRDISSARSSSRPLIYSYLRSVGISPDELDSLDLPLTVDVMRDRVQFLLSLGLSVPDLNSYPLLLACSVKKNLIPVLDFLGNLGVRRPLLPALLRRYPQVLHSSVVVDLAPVVSYLQGLDVKPVDVPRVLERYPDVLGFKLEGTMSTSIAYLVAIGVTRRQIGSIITRYPEILGMRVGRVIKPFVEYLESLSVRRPAVAGIIESKPFIFGFDLREMVKPNVETLLKFCVREDELASVIVQYPEILGMELEAKLIAQRSLLESTIMIEEDDFGRVVEKMPQVVNLGRSAVIKHVDFLKRCGFSLKQVSTMVVECPQVLALNLDIMKMSFDYFQEEMERDLEDLVAFPAFFTYGLESTVKPRHGVVAKKGLTCSLEWLLNCSSEKFAERMGYDSVGVEEIDPESSFSVQSMSGPRDDVEEDEDDDFSDFYEDDDEEDSDDEFI